MHRPFPPVGLAGLDGVVLQPGVERADGREAQRHQRDPHDQQRAAAAQRAWVRRHGAARARAADEAREWKIILVRKTATSKVEVKRSRGSRK